MVQALRGHPLTEWKWFSRHRPATRRDRGRKRRAPLTHMGDFVWTGPVVAWFSGGRRGAGATTTRMLGALTARLWLHGLSCVRMRVDVCPYITQRCTLKCDGYQWGECDCGYTAPVCTQEHWTIPIEKYLAPPSLTTPMTLDLFPRILGQWLTMSELDTQNSCNDQRREKMWSRFLVTERKWLCAICC